MSPTQGWAENDTLSYFDGIDVEPSDHRYDQFIRFGDLPDGRPFLIDGDLSIKIWESHRFSFLHRTLIRCERESIVACLGLFRRRT